MYRRTAPKRLHSWADKIKSAVGKLETPQFGGTSGKDHRTSGRDPLSWYPEKAGNILARCLVGHSVMIQVQPIFNEICIHNEAIHNWLAVVPKNEAGVRAGLMVGSLVIQMTTFPIWMIITAASPAVTHCCLRDANEILSQKYDTVSKGAPSQFQKFSSSYDHAHHNHKKNARGTFKTDIIGALILFWLIYWCTF